MHMNSRKEDREILRKNGFAENEVLLLSKLRIDYNEKEVRQALADRRRLEFYQWMFETGKLSDSRKVSGTIRNVRGAVQDVG
jgi:hypothetical protein